MKKTKDTDYLFITPLIRAREANLITQARAERMINAATAADAAKVLEECGYEGISEDISRLDAVISEKHRRDLDELSTLVPDAEIVQVFRLQYDYHNAKTIIKAQAADREYDSILSDLGSIPAEELVSAMNRNNFSDLPDFFAAAITDARDTLAKTGDPQLSDSILDKAYFADFTARSKKAGSDFLMGYARAMIDSANMKTAARARKAGIRASAAQRMLIDGGSVGTNEITDAIAHSSPLAPIFDRSDMRDASAIVDEAIEDDDGTGKLMTELEKLCDNCLTGYLEKAHSVGFGDEVVVSYIAALENDAQRARMLLSGRIAGFSGAEIRERLRDFNV